jgi:mannose-6-phosphate isomerase-like protein (cupin superfamily)
MSATPIVHQPGKGETLHVVGETIRILVDSAATGGACLVFENTSPPGSGPPLHRHGRDDEAFFVVEGTVKFSVNGQEAMLGPGGFAFAPRGSIHTFLNVGPGPCRMIITCTPGGLEVPFRECDALARQGRMTPEAVTAAFQKFDLDIMGPPLKK